MRTHAKVHIRFTDMPPDAIITYSITDVSQLSFDGGVVRISEILEGPSGQFRSTYLFFPLIRILEVICEVQGTP